MIFTKEKIEEFNTLLANAKKVVITAHKSPDGDSIGSSLALYHYITKEHDNVAICHPDMAPNFLHWMLGSDQVIAHQEREAEVCS